MPSLSRNTPSQPTIVVPRPKPVPERPWEGEFTARFQSGDAYIVPVKLTIQVHAHLIEGKGRSLTYPGRGADDERCFELTGTRNARFVTFDLWFASKVVGRIPWRCEGRLNADRDAISGHWSMDCLDSEDCNCGGPSGPYEMKRCR